MHDDALLQSLFEQAGRLAPADRARLAALLLGEPAGGERGAYAAELELLDAAQLRELAAQWLALSAAQAGQARAAALPDQKEANPVLTAAFLASVAHELRNPLGAMLSFVTLLGDEGGAALSARQRDFQQKLLRNTRHVIGLVNDILDLLKVYGGRLTPYREELELLPVVEVALATAAATFQDRGLRYVLELGSEAPRALGDRARVRQVLLNILAVVTQLAGADSVVVGVAGGGQPTIRVQSAGLTIPEAYRATMFEEFPVLEGLRAGRGLSFGPGLMLARELARLMGGEVWAEELAPDCTAFFFRLPGMG